MGKRTCGDGIDNDGDGQTDEGCTTLPPPQETCGDGIDNDGDGQTDEGCTTLPPPPEETCGDGIDNDGDGQTDEDCTTLPPPPPCTVTDVTWKQITSPLGQNQHPEFERGQSIFPDRDTNNLQDARDRNTVLVEATVANAPNGTFIYFAAFDVDDPDDRQIFVDNNQPDEEEDPAWQSVDKNDTDPGWVPPAPKDGDVLYFAVQHGNDNRGSPGRGTWQAGDLTTFMSKSTRWASCAATRFVAGFRVRHASHARIESAW